MIKKLGIAGACALSLAGTQFQASDSQKQFARNAVCVLEPIGRSTVKGLVSFSQYSINSQVKVASSIRGLRANFPYSLHIHESGDLTKDDKLLRNVYPEKFMKSQDWDMAILTSDFKGTIFACTQTDDLTLYGDKSIIGRSVAIRAVNQLQNQLQFQVESLGIIGLSQGFATLRPLQ